jgi:hypothetical protein
MIATFSPRAMEKSTPRSAATVASPIEYVRVSPRPSMSGGVDAAAG